MKWLVWVLLILNFALLGFFLASSYFADPPPEPTPPAPYTGNIKLLTAEMLAAMPRKAAPAVPAAPVPTACYEWSGFSPAEAARASLALKQLGLQATPKKRAETSKKRFWVYIPSQKSLALAEAKVAELQTLGVADSFIVREPKWRYAISLGIFKDEALAGDYLQKLHGIGVKNAIKAKRDDGNSSSQTSYLINGISAVEISKLDALKPQFPGSELNPVDCR
jgi:hypothetical protein